MDLTMIRVLHISTQGKAVLNPREELKMMWLVVSLKNIKRFPP